MSVRPVLVLLLVGIPAIAASSAAAPAAPISPAAAASARVNVRLKEWSITPTQRRERAGEVTFVVHNAGTLEHELVVIRTNRPADDLPRDGREASETGSRGEIDGVRPGGTGRLTLDLRPGKYVLICNRSDHHGHYRHGMFASFTVR